MSKRFSTPSDLYNEHYRNSKKLGQGRFGSVYIAERRTQSLEQSNNDLELENQTRPPSLTPQPVKKSQNISQYESIKTQKAKNAAKMLDFPVYQSNHRRKNNSVVPRTMALDLFNDEDDDFDFDEEDDVITSLKVTNSMPLKTQQPNNNFHQNLIQKKKARAMAKSVGDYFSAPNNKKPIKFATKVIKSRHKDEIAEVQNEVEIMKKLVENVNNPKIAPSTTTNHKPINRMRHIVKYIDSYVGKPNSYIIMEYVSGGELFDRLEQMDEEAFTEFQSANYIHQICLGLEYMHELKIIHLDLKPENIICCEDPNKIKIADFGIAVDLDNVPDPDDVRQLKGTAEFMSPESISCEPLSTKSDIWTAGVILYFLLSGLSPFLDENDALTQTNVVQCNYVFYDEEFETVSKTAKDWIDGCLQKNPHQRFDVKDALNHRFLLTVRTISDSSEELRDMRGRRLSKNFLANIKQMNAKRRWKRAKEAISLINYLKKKTDKSGTGSSTFSGTSEELSR